MRAAITATGHYLPPDVYPNAFFEKQLDTTDAWIRSRTGIAERHFASAGGTSDLIVPAAGRCLDARGVSATAVDCIIVADHDAGSAVPLHSGDCPAQARSHPRLGFRPGGGVLGLRLWAHRGHEAGGVRRGPAAAALWGGPDEQCD